MIKPLLQDDEFLADVRRASFDERRVHLWWLGQSGFLVKHSSRYLLIDPYLSDSLTSKYAGTDKPHERLSERVIAPERLDFIDVITSSHNHTDHLDRETILPVLKTSPAAKVVVPEANRDFAAERLNLDTKSLVGIRENQTRSVAGFLITGLPAAHNALERDEQGNPLFMGYHIRAGDAFIYHSGDTVWNDEVVMAVKKHRIDLALLPINGDRPERRVAGNLNGAEAARMAKTISAGLVVPCHYDLFAFNTASPGEFVAECQRLDQPHRVLRLGERITLG